MATQLQKRIAAGIAFLNVVKPNWLKKIDIEQLDLSKSKTCMLGEVFGDYGEAIQELGLESDKDYAAQCLGFYEDDWNKYKELTNAWKKALRPLLKGT